jgi:hypothetical protein
MKERKRDFALVAAHSKFGTSFTAVRNALIYPVKSMAESAFHIHGSKRMDHPSRAKGVACSRKRWWVL